MRGSSIDRQDRRRKRARLNGALRGKAEGEAGSPCWEERLSVEPLWPGLLWTHEEEFWAWAPEGWFCPALASAPSSVPKAWGTGDELGWKSPSEIELERKSGTLLPSAAFVESLSWQGTPQGENLKSKRLFSMHISAGKTEKSQQKIERKKIVDNGISFYISLSPYLVYPW